MPVPRAVALVDGAGGLVEAARRPVSASLAGRGRAGAGGAAGGGAFALACFSDAAIAAARSLWLADCAGSAPLAPAAFESLAAARRAGVVGRSPPFPDGFDPVTNDDPWLEGA